MPCHYPIPARHYFDPDYTSKWQVNFKSKEPSNIEISCGQCIGCRLEKAKEWALRCTHEAQVYGDENAFITLTYDDHNLPDDATLVKEHWQKFIRSLRKKTKQKIRYYMCGEYGNICTAHDRYISEPVKDKIKCTTCTTGRPHYHAILFGYKFPDAYYWTTRNGNRIYRSASLENTWYQGHSEIGSVNFQSAGYIARYTLKKQTGDRAENHYNGKLPEYTNMSLRPGIGKIWYEKNKTDLFPHDYAILPNGSKTAVPAYYRQLLEKEDPELYEQLKLQRLEKARDNPDNTPERRADFAEIQNLRAQKLKRTLQ